MLNFFFLPTWTKTAFQRNFAPGTKVDFPVEWYMYMYPLSLSILKHIFLFGQLKIEEVG